MSDPTIQPPNQAATTPPAPVQRKPAAPKAPKPVQKGESYAEVMVKGKQKLEEIARVEEKKRDIAEHIYTLRCEFVKEHDGIFFMDGFRPAVGQPITQDDWYSTYHKAGETFPEPGQHDAPWCQECWNGGNGRKTGLPLHPVRLSDGTVGYMLTEGRYVKRLTREQASRRAEALVTSIEEAARG